MAKRATGKTDPTGTPSQPRARRPRQAERSTADTGTAAANDAVATIEERALAVAPDPLPEIPEPGDAADRASQSMASEPSEQDIRLRAYHRFLARGAVHGSHFDDWVEAERELKRTK